MNIDIDKPIQPRQFGELVGVSQQAIYEYCKQGVLTEHGTLREWLLSYSSRLREQAAGRATSTGLSLADESADLKRHQKWIQKVKLHRELNEWMPVNLLTIALSKATAQIATHLDAITVQLRRNWPDINEGQMNIVREQIAKARNIIATTDLTDLLTEDDFDYLKEFDPDAQ